MRTFAWLPLLAAVAACSSTSNSGPSGPSSHTDGGVHADATASDATADATDSGARTDGATHCGAAAGDTPDFGFGPAADGKFDGPVTAIGIDGGQLELVAQDGTRVLFYGAAPAIPLGTTLWATLDQLTVHGNPFASTTYTEGLLRAGQHGALLAQTLVGDVPTTDGVASDFLGAKVSVVALYSTGTCPRKDLYSVTIHGDTDTILAPGTHCRVTIGGVEYDVSLGQAEVQSYPPQEDGSVSRCLPSDWVPPAGFRLNGHAVHF